MNPVADLHDFAGNMFDGHLACSGSGN